MILTYVVIIILLALSALFSGLNLGLMALNPYDLRRKVRLGSTEAIKIYPLREKGNLLLCTLLLGNVAVNSILAIFLGSLITGVAASILATGLIVVFGEILPQAVFAKYALRFGSKVTWIMYPILYLLYPVAKPLSMGLDYLLGGETPTAYSRKEVRLILEEQRELAKSDLKKHHYEIMKGGLVFSDKTVKEVMTPWRDTFFVSPTELLTRETLVRIKENAPSRIPVYDKGSKKVVGILYSKDMVSLDPDEHTPVQKVMRRNSLFIGEHDKLDKVLNLFKKNHVHLFIVRNKFNKPLGIITLEDVLEEIVGEIVDEHDFVEFENPKA